MAVPWALRNALDHNLMLTASGMKTYLRVANQEDSEIDEEYATYGFQISPTGSNDAGVSDLEIKPQPSVEELSLHNIGLNGTRLQFGAHSFLISHTWVKDRASRLGLADAAEVFNSTNVIGLVYNGRLFSIESVRAESVGGEVISWLVLGNKHEKGTTT